MTDFLAKQRTDEEAQIREWVKDNPTATSREFDTFMSKQRTDQQPATAPSSRSSRRLRTRVSKSSRRRTRIRSRMT